MKIPAELGVGVATHTGYVRVGNEDDYLLAASPVREGAFLAAIADGMGGALGGAEASRTALRAMATAVLDGSDAASTHQRLAAGFGDASRRVFEAAAVVPALRDMGTTMTAICLEPGLVTYGHVGDTRLYRLRAGNVEQLTTDHAVRQPDNLLTRCIGGGQPGVEVDHGQLPTTPGDRFVLVTDGVWSVVPPALFKRLAERGEPGVVAEALVSAALSAGGPDNATAVVLDVRATVTGAPPADVGLPREERLDDRDHWPAPVSLRPPLWPWLLVLAAVLALAHELVLRLGGAGFG